MAWLQKKDSDEMRDVNSNSYTDTNREELKKAEDSRDCDSPSGGLLRYTSSISAVDSGLGIPATIRNITDVFPNFMIDFAIQLPLD